MSELPDELAKQLAEGMESFMRRLAEEHPDQAPDEGERKFQEAWEKMLIDGMNNMGSDGLLGPDSTDKSSEPADSTSKKSLDDFQASVLQAMEKLKDSDSTLHVRLFLIPWACMGLKSLQTGASTSATASADPLEALLSQLSAGLDEAGEDNGDLQEMLETMMQQLMSKEVLYEPLKELHEKVWLFSSRTDEG